jgi:hypothetical protein
MRPTAVRIALSIAGRDVRPKNSGLIPRQGLSPPTDESSSTSHDEVQGCETSL